MRQGCANILFWCLLTAGLALPTQQIPLAAHYHTSKNHSISVALFAELEELARIVDISYCVGGVGLGIQKPFECPSRCKDFEGFELITTWNTGPLLSDSCGYIAISHAPSPERVIVAFRGTYSISNTIADLSTMPQEYAPYPGADHPDDDPNTPKCTNCTVHSGFHSSWENTRDEILPHILNAMELYPGYAVTLVGHSLGGAVAAFAGLELLARGLHPTVTTFGEPRIGNQAMADYLDYRFNLTHNSTTSHDRNSIPFRRVTHVADPVPLLPLDEWGYKPHGGEIFIAKPDLSPSVADVVHCEGASDPTCLTGPLVNPDKTFWTIPTRFKLWQIFFAHRDYFWRLGLCVPTVDFFWPNRNTDL